MTLLLQSFLTNPQILNKPKAKTATPDFTNRELAVEASCTQWCNQASAVATVPAAVAMLSVFDCNLTAHFSSVVQLKQTLRTPEKDLIIVNILNINEN